jgi:hypothetical protein
MPGTRKKDRHKERKDRHKQREEYRRKGSQK